MNKNLLFFLIPLLFTFGTVQAQDQPLRLTDYQMDDAYSIAFSPDGKYLSCGSWNGSIAIWEYKDSAFIPLQFIGSAFNSPLTAINFSRENKFIIAGSQGGKFATYKNVTNDEGVSFVLDTTILTHNKPITQVIYGPVYKFLFSSSEDGKIIGHDLEKKRTFETDNSNPVLGFDISIDRRWFYVGDRTGVMNKYNAINGKSTKTFEGHTDQINSVAFAINRKFVLTASNDKTVIQWDPNTGDSIKIFRGHTWSVNDVKIAATSTHFVTGSTDGTVRVWSVDSGQVAQFEAPGRTITSVAISPDLQWVTAAVVAEDGKQGPVVWATGLPLPKPTQAGVNKNRKKAKAKSGKSGTPPTKKGATKGAKVIHEDEDVKISVE